MRKIKKPETKYLCALAIGAYLGSPPFFPVAVFFNRALTG